MTLELYDVRYTYPGFPPTLNGVQLTVADGESGFLLGPSGCGKSTLLRVIAGLLTGHEGQVRLNGQAIDDLPPHRRRVGLLFQEPTLFPHLNVWQNVAFGLRYRGVPHVEHRTEALRWLDLVGLRDRADSAVDALSGGQRQRVDLARTLAAKPRAVLLDEPFSALDRDLRDELGPRVRELLAEAGVPALWVTHDHDEAHRLGDHVWRLEEGLAIQSKP
ncbi:MAG: ABC transporter ATP-binding protein [Thermoplasmatota archaeon]